MKHALKVTFRDHLDARRVIDDFRFSMEVTDRHCVQVLMLEDIVLMLSRANVPGAVVECGVFTGGASAYMLRSILRNFPAGRRPTYWGFDSFEGMPHASAQDGDDAVKWLVGVDSQNRPVVPKDGKLAGTSINKADYQNVSAYLAKSGYPRDKITLVQGWFQDTLPTHVKRVGEISLLRLDGDFYESTKTSLESLAGSVAPKGVIIFDDYGAFVGCRKAADEFLAVHPEFSPVFRYDAHRAFVIRTS
jgi:O-methyltransferase